jgi:hypothetical protein
MLNRINTVQVCDATGADSSNAARYITSTLKNHFAHICPATYLCTWQQEIIPLQTNLKNFSVKV